MLPSDDLLMKPMARPFSQILCDQNSEYFGCSLTYFVELGIPEIPFDRKVFGVPVAAVDLECVLAYSHGDFGCKILALSRLLMVVFSLIF